MNDTEAEFRRLVRIYLQRWSGPNPFVIRDLRDPIAGIPPVVYGKQDQQC